MKCRADALLKFLANAGFISSNASITNAMLRDTIELYVSYTSESYVDTHLIQYSKKTWK